MTKKHAFDIVALDDLTSDEAIAKLEKRAAFDASNEQPEPGETELSTAENRINSDCTTLLTKAAELADNALAEQDNIRRPLLNLDDGILESVEKQIDNNIEFLKDQKEHDLLEKIEKVITADRDLRIFRNKHKLSHSAQYPKNKFWAVAILTTMLLFESYLNAEILAVKAIGGVFEGWRTAIFISLANILIGFFSGFMPGRFSFYKPSLQRNASRWGVGALCIIVIALNASFAHYRLTLSDEFINLSLTVWQSITSQPFAIFGDIKSFALLIIGVGCSIVAGWKGFKWDDIYPFYGSKTRVLEDARHALMEEENNLRTAAVQYSTKARHSLEEFLSATAEKLNRLHKSLDDSKLIIKRYDELCDKVKRDHAQLFAVYRETNKSIRNLPAPAYFKQEPPFPARSVSINRNLTEAKAAADRIDTEFATFDQRAGSITSELINTQKDILENLNSYFQDMEKKAYGNLNTEQNEFIENGKDE